MNIAMVAADLTKKVAYGLCRVTSVYGYNNQTSDRFALFFQAPTVAANDVPTSKGLYFPAQTGASYGANAFGEGVSLSELLVAISTVPEKYTAVGAATGLELTIIVETAFPYITATTISGDLTTGVANKQIWAESGGPKSLKSLTVMNNSGVTVYPVVQASDSALTTDTTAKIMLPLDDGETTYHTFGPAGLSPFRDDAGTLRQGCTVRFATTFKPFVFASGADFKVRAIYE